MGSAPIEDAASCSESVEANPTLEPESAESVLPTAESLGLKTVALPHTANGILHYNFYPEAGRHHPQKIIGTLTVKLMSSKSLTTSERQAIFDLLKGLSQIDVFSRAAEDTLQIKYMMLSILGVWPRAKRPYEFPEVFQDGAASILAKLEADLEVEEVVGVTPSAPTPLPPATKAKKRSRTAPSSGQSLAPALDDQEVRTYMHNLELNDGARRMYRLKDKSLARSCNVFGHNGLTVGKWWPYRICALRDGAHGATQGGIAGSAKDGAYSVVVSGDYDELDRDERDVLWYSGSDSSANTDPNNAIITTFTKALRESYQRSRVIRVLRTSGGRAAHCPSKGIRYDGLYRIVSEGTLHNTVGGAYVRFKLVSEGNQAGIDLGRPNREERDVYDRLKSGG